MFSDYCSLIREMNGSEHCIGTHIPYFLVASKSSDKHGRVSRVYIPLTNIKFGYGSGARADIIMGFYEHNHIYSSPWLGRSLSNLTQTLQLHLKSENECLLALSIDIIATFRVASFFSWFWRHSQLSPASPTIKNQKTYKRLTILNPIFLSYFM